jgi:hypothetical protein
VMLCRWVHKGHPSTCLQLQLLMNPAGLLQALLECYAWKYSVRIDTLSLDIRLVDFKPAIAVSKPESSNTSLFLSSQRKEEYERLVEEHVVGIEDKLDLEYNGCVLVVHCVRLLGAMWDEDKYTLRFLSRYATTLQNSQVILKFVW